MSTSNATTAELGILELKQTPEQVKAPAKPRVSVSSLRKPLTIAGVSAAVLAGVYYTYSVLTFVSTDNATIEARTTLLAPRVGGLIVASPVDENQHVKKGQVLAQIRKVEYENALIQAQAERESLAAELKNADSAYNRAKGLIRQGATTQERLDAAEAQYHSLAAKLKSAESQVSQAELNLADTDVLAPADGTISKKSFEVGMMASAGQPLLGFVEGNERWATANFKETEMKGLLPGRPAEVEVDAVSGHKFHGVVESISPSTGAVFSLLPPDNATGNFTKVVQRVPVRVRLENLSAEDVELLQAGLSVEVTVRVR